ncbi:MAG: glycosyltransferase family 2 protein [Bernardetiaceae bacterium]
MKISAVIITYNEAKNITDCLESCRGIADELLVLDSFSSDETLALAISAGAVVHQHAFDDFVQQKNRAIDLATHDWILSLDADERLSPELRAAIAARKAKGQPSADAYQFSRLSSYCGQWIRYGGWYPDRKTRLFHRQKARWAGQKVHEYLRLTPEAQTELLPGDLHHHTYDSIEQHITKANHYSTLAAEALHERGRSTHWGQIIFSPLFSFWRSYFWRQGWRDGFYGFVIAAVGSFGRLLRYLKLYRLSRKPNA